MDTRPRFTLRAGKVSLIVWLAVMVCFFVALAVWTKVPLWVAIMWVAVPTAGVVLIFIAGRRKGPEDGDSYEMTSHTARSEGRLIVGLPISDIPIAIQRAAEHQPRFSVIELTSEHAKIKGRMNFKTWGMTTHLKYRSLDPERVEITAFCEPRLGTTLVDYGQSRLDIRLLLQGIEDFDKEHHPAREV